MVLRSLKISLFLNFRTALSSLKLMWKQHLCWKELILLKMQRAIKGWFDYSTLLSVFQQIIMSINRTAYIKFVDL